MTASVFKTNLADKTIYATNKRFYYFLSVIQKLRQGSSALRILELGCGTGEGLVLPLAEALQSQAEIHGIDIDPGSIRHAQSRASELNLQNTVFYCGTFERLPTSISNEPYDVVITSEILEHCENPLLPLKTANDLLKIDGTLLVTIPNGYGPFELESFFWNGLGMEKYLDKFRSHRSSSKKETTAHSLNTGNPHMGFYTLTEVSHILRKTGFEIVERQNREFFCGPFSYHLTNLLTKIGLGQFIIHLSHNLAPYLPAFMVADWMITAKKIDRTKPDMRFDLPKGLMKKVWWRLKRKCNNTNP